MTGLKIFGNVNLMTEDELNSELERLFPVDPEYEVKRAYIMQKLKEKYPERDLINFHYTPGGPPFASKEKLWEELDKAESRRTKVLNFGDSNRIDYDNLS